jgi:hypothetical protein
MSKTMIIFRVMLAGLFIGVLLAGCVSTEKIADLRLGQICSETTAERLSDLTDSELHELLNAADDGSGIDDCWITIVKASLDEGRNIPRRHLVQAVKIFNNRQHEQYFHKSMYRYFTVISENPSIYRPVDRTLLDSYCSYLINSAETNRDSKLRQIKWFCRKLDRSLYARYFE